jgi:hypothetical protein
MHSYSTSITQLPLRILPQRTPYLRGPRAFSRERRRGGRTQQWWSSPRQCFLFSEVSVLSSSSTWRTTPQSDTDNSSFTLATWRGHNGTEYVSKLNPICKFLCSSVHLAPSWYLSSFSSRGGKRMHKQVSNLFEMKLYYLEILGINLRSHPDLTHIKHVL